MNVVMESGNLPAVVEGVVTAVGASRPVSSPAPAAANTGGAELKRAGAFTAFMIGPQEYRVVVTHSNGVNFDYKLERKGVDGGYHPILRQDGQVQIAQNGQDVVFGGEVFILRHFWNGAPDAGDVFTFSANPDATLVPLPVLFARKPNPPGINKADAITINVVNSIVSGDTVIFGDPRGPIVPLTGPLGGPPRNVDILREYVSLAYVQAGYDGSKMVIVNQRAYHTLMGGIHCATNVIREIPNEKWWTQ